MAREAEVIQRNAAERAREAEAKERRAAELNLERANRRDYFNQISLAKFAWDGADIPKMKRSLNQCPERFRSWEWGRLQRLTHTELRSLKGHSSWVTSVVFSPDGTRIISSGADKSIKLWDTQAGAEIRTFRRRCACESDWRAARGRTTRRPNDESPGAPAPPAARRPSRCPNATGCRPMKHNGICACNAFAPPRLRRRVRREFLPCASTKGGDPCA